MNTLKIWRIIGTGLVSCAVGAGLAWAKLPALDDAGKAKAEEAKAKAAEAAKKDGEQLAKVQDRVAERYKKEKGVKTVAAKPEPAAKKK